MWWLPKRKMFVPPKVRKRHTETQRKSQMMAEGEARDPQAKKHPELLAVIRGRRKTKIRFLLREARMRQFY